MKTTSRLPLFWLRNGAEKNSTRHGSSANTGTTRSRLVVPFLIQKLMDHHTHHTLPADRSEDWSPIILTGKRCDLIQLESQFTPFHLILYLLSEKDFWPTKGAICISQPRLRFGAIIRQCFMFGPCWVCSWYLEKFEHYILAPQDGSGTLESGRSLVQYFRRPSYTFAEPPTERPSTFWIVLSPLIPPPPTRWPTSPAGRGVWDPLRMTIRTGTICAYS